MAPSAPPDAAGLPETFCLACMPRALPRFNDFTNCVYDALTAGCGAQALPLTSQVIPTKPCQYKSGEMGAGSSTEGQVVQQNRRSAHIFRMPVCLQKRRMQRSAGNDMAADADAMLSRQ
eukprot:1160210-Pelagomonas_calceolata.AAC.10